MPLNAASYAEDLALNAGKPPATLRGKGGKVRRGWKGFYGSVHDIVCALSNLCKEERLMSGQYSYPCEDGDVDLVKDASISLAAHGQYM
jgi:histone deacetylase HOS3